MTARFRDVIVLTYAVPATVLRPLVPATMVLETRDEHAFVAVAVVDMAALRPTAAPAWAGSDAVFVGYRVFVSTELEDGRRRRGLKVLRTDVDRTHLLVGTRLLTRYDAGLVTARWQREDGRHRVRVRPRWRGAGLDVSVIDDRPAAPPPSSPFADWNDARPFSGPLPWTLAPTGDAGAIAVKGVRSAWHPRPVTVDQGHVGFFDRGPFADHEPVLAAAFHLADVDYRWEAGREVAIHTPAGAAP